MKDIFVHLDGALKKLVIVYNWIFNERFLFKKHKNDNVEDLREQINIILHRAERAILSQKQSAREITHQIRTPLMSILQRVDYFHMYGFIMKKREEMLNIIESRVDRITFILYVISLKKWIH
ncbi:hypothetical protein AB1282_23820 [Gottfriedia sp. S16(2024)]|uniref:hypothetical protein n=1 Tax=Gottfriedia sp. S16(2024) TaxID=3162883 RepID=UPI003D2633A3